VQERNWGEQDHSRTQALLIGIFLRLEKQLGIRVFPEQRIQVSRSRFRVPDVCVVCGPRPQEQIFTKPPFICVEILSLEDRMGRMQERTDDYLAFGVPHVWMINPYIRRAYICTPEGIQEAKQGILRSDTPEIVVPLAEIFGAE